MVNKMQTALQKIYQHTYYFSIYLSYLMFNPKLCVHANILHVTIHRLISLLGPLNSFTVYFFLFWKQLWYIIQSFGSMQAIYRPLPYVITNWNHSGETIFFSSFSNSDFGLDPSNTKLLSLCKQPTHIFIAGHHFWIIIWKVTVSLLVVTVTLTLTHVIPRYVYASYLRTKSQYHMSFLA